MFDPLPSRVWRPWLVLGALTGLGTALLVVAAAGPPSLGWADLSVHARAIIWSFVAISLIVPGGVGLMAHLARQRRMCGHQNGVVPLVLIGCTTVLLAMVALYVIAVRLIALVLVYLEQLGLFNNPSGK